MAGVYAGPGSLGLSGAKTYATAMHRPVTQILDFPPTATWADLEGPSWLLAAHQGETARLEYSEPMLPDTGDDSLAQCADGQYDVHWLALGANMAKYGLGDSVIRPGWEFNGNWFRWSIGDHPEDYAGCFRHLVTSMRSVPGTSFLFDWNPGAGVISPNAEAAYPGDGYVDFVGLSIYDQNWGRYTGTSAQSPPTAAQRNLAWNDLSRGPGGLQEWSAFAASHGLPMGISEWGVCDLDVGHGGEDNATFVDRIFNFVQAPANHVAYENYFNWASSADRHVLTGNTQFPASFTRAEERLRLW